MLFLKSKIDEELRIGTINNYVTYIYKEAIQQAKTSTSTSYSLDIDPQRTYMKRKTNINVQYCSQYKFYKDNMEEILSGLQRLFPDCSVKLSNMCTGNDGKRYDISTMDEKMLPFINQQNTFECIIIDWS
jgi:hypothetical protein